MIDDYEWRTWGCYAPAIITTHRVAGQDFQVSRKCSGHHQYRKRGTSTWKCCLCNQIHVPKKRRAA